MQTLTKKQKLVLDYIRRFIEEHGHAPSYEEIAQGMGSRLRPPYIPT